MSEGEVLKELQVAVGATDEEIAAKANLSKTTLRRAMKGEATAWTKKSILQAMETLRLERIDRLTKIKVKTAG